MSGAKDLSIGEPAPDTDDQSAADMSVQFLEEGNAPHVLQAEHSTGDITETITTKTRRSKKNIANVLLLDQQKMTWAKRISLYIHPQDFRALFMELGIPGEAWRSAGWMAQRSGKHPDEGGIGVSFWGLQEAIKSDARFNGYRRFVQWMDGGEGPLTHIDAVRSCTTPDQFRAYFKKVGIPGEEWRSGHYLVYISKRPVADGGINRGLSGLKSAITKDPRFYKYYPKFVAWMDGEKAPSEDQPTWKDFVSICETPKEMLSLLESHGVTDDRWKRSEWVAKESSYPPSEGGIGTPLRGFYKAILKDTRFGRDYRTFVAWMEGKDQADLLIVERVNTCTTPQDYLQLFEDLGIPDTRWQSTKWMLNTSGLPVEQGGMGHCQSWPHSQIVKKFKGYKKFLRFMGVTEIMQEWKEPMAKLKTPQDFLEFFREIGIPGDAWQKTDWMLWGSLKPVEEGGIGRSLGGLKCAITRRPEFEKRWNKFLHWMGVTELRSMEMDWGEQVTACETPENFLNLFRKAGVPGTEWKNLKWFIKHSKHPPPIGIGKNLAGLGRAVMKRFGKSNRAFRAWMGVPFMCAKTSSCKSREDFLSLFAELGIPDEQWRSVNWLRAESIKPATEGGIGRSCSMIYHGIITDKRFGEDWSNFISFMDNTLVAGESPSVRLQTKRAEILTRAGTCNTREDFLQMFADIGITGDNWRIRDSIRTATYKQAGEPDIGLSLSMLADYITERFSSYARFVRWMSGEALDQIPKESYSAIVRACTTPQDFLSLFEREKIPPEKWRSKRWMTEQIILPVERGGIGRPLSALGFAILMDPRWNNAWRQFEAFMDGKELEEGVPMLERVMLLEAREEYLSFFKKLGIPGDNWRSSNWLERTAREEPPVGIGQSLQKVAKALRTKFKGFKKFIAWMDRKNEPDPTSAEFIATFTEPAQFMAYFTSKNIPEAAWSKCNWFMKKSGLPLDAGGIGENMSGIGAAIRRRFGSHPAFVAWMKGAEVPTSRVDDVRACQAPTDFLALFASFHIPDNAWRSSGWLSKISKLPPEEGGINFNCAGIYSAIKSDPRFRSFEHFKEWMDGIPLEGIKNAEQAQAIIIREAERLGIDAHELLSPEMIIRYKNDAPALLKVMEYFQHTLDTIE